MAQATVFAPTNVAFSLVPKSTLQVFLNNEVKLKEVSRFKKLLRIELLN